MVGVLWDLNQCVPDGYCNDRTLQTQHTMMGVLTENGMYAKPAIDC